MSPEGTERTEKIHKRRNGTNEQALRAKTWLSCHGVGGVGAPDGRREHHSLLVFASVSDAPADLRRHANPGFLPRTVFVSLRFSVLNLQNSVASMGLHATPRQQNVLAAVTVGVRLFPVVSLSVKRRGTAAMTERHLTFGSGGDSGHCLIRTFGQSGAHNGEWHRRRSGNTLRPPIK